MLFWGDGCILSVILYFGVLYSYKYKHMHGNIYWELCVLWYIIVVSNACFRSTYCTYIKWYAYVISFCSFPDGYMELCYTMKVPMDVILHRYSINRAYKYFVLSPATKDGAIHCFEFIAGVRTSRAKVINRCLKLHAPLDKVHPGG